MRKFFALGILTILFAVLAGGRAQAQPDPRDSIILESKAVAADTLATATDTAFAMKVYLTNKDTIVILTLALRESTLTGTAYAVLDSIGPAGNADDGWALADCLHFLKTKLDNSPAEDFSQYNGTSPDRFLVAAAFSPIISNPLRDAEPINLTRSAIWELRFMSTKGGNGCVIMDTSKAGELAQVTQFTIARDNGATILDVPVNFEPGVLDVGRQGGCIPTDVRDVTRGGSLPRQYSLAQNYPNPFNANTQISFALPKAGKTTLEIFNILGQKVNTLVDEYMTAGQKIVNWDGRDLRGQEVPSGIYFYRLRSQDFLQTKKMLMIQ